MKRVINTLISYFLSVVDKPFQDEVPLEVIELINTLDRVDRGNIKKLIFNHAKKMTLKRSGLECFMWVENCFETIERYAYRYHRAYFAPGEDIPDTIWSLLRNARKTADLCVFTISHDTLAREIVNARNRGVRVRLLTDNGKQNDSGSKISSLRKQKISVKTDHSRHHMHNKFGVVDSRIVFTGSFNWTYSATNFNQENLLVTTNYTLVKQYQEEFDKLWMEM